MDFGTVGSSLAYMVIPIAEIILEYIDRVVTFGWLHLVSSVGRVHTGAHSNIRSSNDDFEDEIGRESIHRNVLFTVNDGACFEFLITSVTDEEPLLLVYFSFHYRTRWLVPAFDSCLLVFFFKIDSSVAEFVHFKGIKDAVIHS